MKYIKPLKSDKSFNDILKQRGWMQLVGDDSRGYINAIKANCLSSSFVFDVNKVHISYVYDKDTFKKIKSYNLHKINTDKRGGIISLPTGINLDKSSKNKVVTWIKQKLINIKNKPFHTEMVIGEMDKNKDIQGFTIGNFFKGNYSNRKNNKVFDEKSIRIDCIEIIGINKEDLYSIAEDFKNKFVQQSVLVKDHSTGNIHFLY